MNKRNIIQKSISKLSSTGLMDFIPDEKYIPLVFWGRTGKKLNLRNPKSFNEKIQWMKLFYRNQEMTKLVDKYEVKNWVADKIGENHIIPTLGVWDDFDSIPFEKLPEQFVIKSTHDSGGVIICNDKSKFDIKESRKIINKSISKNYYYHGREWAYKDVKPRVIAEKYMTEKNTSGLKDYKIFTFDGEPYIIQVDFNRFIDHKRNLYSTKWEYIPAEIEYPTDPNTIIEKPEKLDELLLFSQILSKGFPHMRTDFYIIENEVYFGEITFYHGSGFERFSPEEFETEFGSQFKLPVH